MEEESKQRERGLKEMERLLEKVKEESRERDREAATREVKEAYNRQELVRDVRELRE